MIDFIKNRFNKLDVHTLEVVKKSSASIVVKILGMIVGLGISVFLGRFLGVEGLGLINLANRVVLLFSILAIFGMDNVLVKNIAIAFNKNNFQDIGNNIYTSLIFNGILAILLSVLGIWIAPYATKNIFHNSELLIPLLILMSMLIPQTLSRIFASGLNGFRKIWQSNLLNEALGTWVVGAGLLILFLLKKDINIIKVAILYAISRLIVILCVNVYWKKIFHFKGKKKWIGKPMLKMALPLLLVSTTSIIAASSDIVMLGWLGNSKDVGLYSVAARLALLVGFFLQVSNSAISPKLATLFDESRLDEMNKMINRVTSGLMIIAVCFLLIFIMGGNFILGLWGDEFKQAYLLLIILGIGQFFIVSTGCAGLLLVMCGYEKTHGYISLVFIVLNLILNYFLIQNYGAVGAAIATTFTIVIENITKVVYAKKHIGILTIPVNYLFRNQK